jgi:1-acyl-sn-glycerol-3-phosphate acyltransferase
MFKFLSSAIIRILGWKIEGQYPHHEKKLVIIVFHHTSNWDFPMGILLRNSVGFKANFVMKGNMFKPPFGFIFRWMGGYPVERDPKKKKFNLTDSIVNLYNENENFTITFTPEGTRSKVRTLKTGSWLIAKKANVPILYIEFDFGKKIFRLSETHYACPTFKEEYEMMKDYFSDSTGLIKELSFNFEDNDMQFRNTE